VGSIRKVRYRRPPDYSRHGIHGGWRAFAAALISGACLASCGSSAGGERTALEVLNGFSAHFPATTGDLLDLGVPGLHNTTGSPIQLVNVQLVNPGPSVRMVGEDAYRYAESGGGVLSEVGDLPQRCPAKYLPHPVTSVTVDAHSDSAWYVVLALRVPKPGSYWLGRLRIDYVSNGQHFWQYQNVDTRLEIKAGDAEHIPKSECSPPPG
jgi:hypothetical protein